MKLLKYVKERKLSLSIYLSFFIFLIVILVLRNIKPDLYQISVLLFIFIFLLSQYFDFEYRYFIGFALILLVACPFLLIAKYETLAEYFANYVYGFLVLGIIGYFLDNLREKIKKKGYFKIYKIVFLSVFILVLIATPIVFNRDLVLKVPNYIKYRYLRTFCKGVYYGKKDEVILNGELLKEKIVITIDEPKGNSIVCGNVNIRGWVVEGNSREDSGIDKIEVFLDGNYGEGEYLGSTDTNILREDVGKVYGRQFDVSGFEFEFNSLKFKNDKHTVYIYAHNPYFGWDYMSFEIFIDN